METVSAHIFVFGQVQGVFFRRSAKIEANRLGIFGWVRNRQSLRSSTSSAGLKPDGSVELLAEGTKEKVNEFIKWCKKGPPFAKVESVEVQWKKNLENFDNFEIL